MSYLRPLPSGFGKDSREIRERIVHGPRSTVKVAVMGCEVNGPGEAKDADIGIAFGKNQGVLFKKGKIVKRIKAKNAVRELIKNL